MRPSFKSWIAVAPLVRVFLTIAFLVPLLSGCTSTAGPHQGPEQEAQTPPPRPASVLLGFWGMREPEMPEASEIGANACQVGNANPVFALQHLDEAASFGIRCSLRIVGGHSFYEDANGELSLEKYLARVDEFWAKAEERGVVQRLLDHVASGTWWGVMLLDDLGTIGRPTVAQIDAMAARTKQYAPLLSTYVRERSTKLVPGTYRTLDAVMPQYEANMGDHVLWAEYQIEAARDLNIPVVIFSLQALNGGSGESGQRGSLPGAWAMSADEIRRYGEEFLSRPEAAGLYAWEFDPSEVLAGGCASDDYWQDRCGAGSGRADAWRQLSDQASDIPARPLLRD